MPRNSTWTEFTVPIENIVDHLEKAQKRIQLRQTALFYKADSDYGRRVAEGLGLPRIFFLYYFLFNDDTVYYSKGAEHQPLRKEEGRHVERI
jgi:hypothetical protein